VILEGGSAHILSIRNPDVRPEERCHDEEFGARRRQSEVVGTPTPPVADHGPDRTDSLDDVDLDLFGDVSRSEQRLRIRVERRRYGKAVTVIDGFERGTDVRALASHLKKRLGTGGTVADGRLEVQGDHRSQLPALLADEGYSLVD
jgi:translation initiation factor 1